jgi:hypothetical protein
MHPPTELSDASLQFSSHNGADAAQPLQCRVDFPRWQCEVPADVPFDLRIATANYAPLFYWDVVARPKQTRDLEPQVLVRGASFAGTVEGPNRKPIAGANVTLASVDAPADNRPAAALLKSSAKTNARGFFQFAGVAPGNYRLVAKAEGLAPAVVPSVRLDSNEAVTWPSPLRLSAWVPLDVEIDPPLDPDGKRWMVAAVERTPLEPGSERFMSRAAAASDQGRWSAKRLRPDAYTIEVRTAANRIAERVVVDLSRGAPAVFPIHIRQTEVRGTVTVGDTPLAASLRFHNFMGQATEAKADEQGHYVAIFPAPGKWRPSIVAEAYELNAAPIEVPESPTPVTIDLRMPGGRIRGSVVNVRDEPVKSAVVTLMREGMLIAQATAKSGTFDFLGLAEGTYSLTAGDGVAAITAAPVPVHLAKNETTEEKLKVEPHLTVRLRIRTPENLPASGVPVFISNDGLSYGEFNADSAGEFEYPEIGAHETGIHVVVVPHGYAAAVASIGLQGRDPDPVTIRLSSRYGMLYPRNPRAYLVVGPLRVSLQMMRPPHDLTNLAVMLEPGTYQVCPEFSGDRGCRDVTIIAGTPTGVDFDTPVAEKQP